jgi:hypothetical protein
MAMTRQNNQTKKGKQSMKKEVSVNEWVAMFEEVGLGEAQRLRWHKLFEARHPEGHQGLLEWLGLKPEEIARIRALSR